MFSELCCSSKDRNCWAGPAMCLEVAFAPVVSRPALFIDTLVRVALLAPLLAEFVGKAVLLLTTCQQRVFEDTEMLDPYVIN